jgi:hypothetical protein
MARGFANLFTPFSVIARELTVIRELYEADLASRPLPVIRITESPGKHDTEVSWGEGDERDAQLRDLLEADDEV